MERVILFSTPSKKNTEDILDFIFPFKKLNKICAYMPSDGANTKQKYTDFWKEQAKNHDVEFVYINNASDNPEDEINKLKKCNILIITGGNTFRLLKNLRRSGLDKAIKEFAKRSDTVISGFSAGAIILTPTIKICNLPGYDENLDNLTDLTGLNIVDFEVFPHYSIDQESVLQDYKKATSREVRPITDDDYLVIDTINETIG